MVKELDGYVRVSRVNGRSGESFISPDEQRATIERWARDKDVTIGAWHEDLDESGGTLDRPGFVAALERVERGESGGLVVAYLSRFARSVKVANEAADRIRDAGGTFVAADLELASKRSAVGKLTFNQMSSIDQYQRDLASENWDTAQAASIARRVSMARPPFGYRKERGEPYVVHEGEAAIVREAFERKTDGATWLELARWLDTAAPKPNGGRWSRTTVASMIRRRAYLGELCHGRHHNARAHEPIVTPAVWRRAQNPTGRRTPRGNYLLSGLVRCASCGRRLRGSSGGRKRPLRIFKCEQADCPSRPTVSVDRLDAEVVEQFFAHLDDFHLRAADDGELAAVRAEVEQRTEAVEAMAAVVPSHPTAIASHQQALEAAEGALTDAEDRLHQLAASAGSAPDVRELRADWPNLTLDERREILRAGIDAVLVRRAASRTARPPVADRILVLFRGEAPDGLADNGRAAGGATAWTWDDDARSLVAAA